MFENSSLETCKDQTWKVKITEHSSTTCITHIRATLFVRLNNEDEVNGRGRHTGILRHRSENTERSFRRHRRAKLRFGLKCFRRRKSESTFNSRRVPCKRNISRPAEKLQMFQRLFRRTDFMHSKRNLINPPKSVSASCATSSLFYHASIFAPRT